MRKVLITGASSDIGLAVCRKYLEQDWHVIGHYRSQRPELEKLRGDNFQEWQCDFSNQTEFEKTLKERNGELKEIDALITLAAEIQPRDFLSITSEDILQAITINYIPSFLLMQIIGPAMLKRNFGRIVHGSSIGVKFGGGESSFTYSLSKHTQEFIPQECRKWAEQNVYVNIVRIGVTDTRLHSKIPHKDMAARAKLIPAGRLASPEEIAGTLFWLGSDNNSFTTNEVIAVSGGE